MLLELDKPDQPLKERRKRAVTSKAKTGCITCKDRRVKCDGISQFYLTSPAHANVHLETKPECLRCSSSGRKCGGYVPFVLWALESSGRKDEKRSFKFFCEKSILQLAGYYDSSFWNRLVMQVSEGEPAIRHMLVAISSLHESIEYTENGEYADSSSDPKRIYAIQQQNKAIKSLTAKGAVPTFETTILCCLLFIVFECLQCSFMPAYHHLISGVTMLRDRGILQANSLRSPKYPMTDDSVVEGIADMFSRLAIQTHTYTDVRAPGSANVTVIESEFTLQPMLPSSFDSLHEARETLDAIIRYASRIVDSVPQGWVGSRKDVFISNMEKLLYEWKGIFDTFIEKNPDKKEDTNLPVKSMQIHHILAEIMTGTFQAGNEKIFDKFNDQFAKLVELADSHGIQDIPRPGQRLVYRLDLGLIGPLYFTTHHCRDPVIRRKASNLLQRTHHIQGIWDSVLAAVIVQKFIEIEERGRTVQSCDDVPESARVRKVYSIFDPSLQRITLRVAHYPYDEFGCPVEDHVIPWVPKVYSTSTLTTADAIAKAEA